MSALASASSSFFVQSVVARGSTSSNKKKSVYKVYANADDDERSWHCDFAEIQSKRRDMSLRTGSSYRKAKVRNSKKMGGEKNLDCRSLTGFASFTLMRRVSEGRGEEEESDYVSLTIWSNKSTLTRGEREEGVQGSSWRRHNFWVCENLNFIFDGFERWAETSVL